MVQLGSTICNNGQLCSILFTRDMAGWTDNRQVNLYCSRAHLKFPYPDVIVGEPLPTTGALGRKYMCRSPKHCHVETPNAFSKKGTEAFKDPRQSKASGSIDVLFPLVGWLIEGCVYPQVQQVNDDRWYTKPAPLLLAKGHYCRGQWRQISLHQWRIRPMTPLDRSPGQHHWQTMEIIQLSIRVCCSLIASYSNSKKDHYWSAPS